MDEKKDASDTGAAPAQPQEGATPETAGTPIPSPEEHFKALEADLQAKAAAEKSETEAKAKEEAEAEAAKLAEEDPFVDERPLRLFLISPAELDFDASGETFHVKQGVNEILPSPEGARCALNGKIAESWSARPFAVHAHAVLSKAHDVRIVESHDVPEA